MRAGIAASATGRRFSRSPPPSAVSTGASSVTRSLGLSSISSRCTRSATRGGGAFALGDRFRIRRTLKDNPDRTSLQLGDTRHNRDRALADRELARLLQPIAMRVAEFVEPIDQLLLGHRLATAQLERTRQNPREDRRPLAVKTRVDQRARERT